MYESLSEGEHKFLSKEIFEKIKGLNYGKVYYDTEENWATKTTMQSEPGILYVYTDHQSLDGRDIPGIKIGDGNAYVVDLPFIDDVYAQHIINTTLHVTQSEKDFWNNKVTCFIDPTKSDKLIFTKGHEGE